MDIVDKMKEAIYPEFYGPEGYIQRGIKITKKQQAIHKKRAQRAVDATLKGDIWASH